MRARPVVWPWRFALRVAAMAVAVLTVWGCSGEPASTGGSGDPAKIQVVMNSTAEERWVVTDLPTLTIGDALREDAAGLFNVVGAARLSDGRIVVANSGSHEIRFFDAGGAFLSATGGDGEGPGEFRRIASLTISPEDSMFVWDGQNLRVSVLAPGGDLVREFRLEKSSDTEFPTFLGRFEDGTLLARAAQVLREAPADGTIVRLQNFFLRYTATGQPVDTLGAFTTPGSLIKHTGDKGLSIYTLPFDPGTRWAIHDRGLYATYGAQAAVREIDGAGDVVRIVRVSRQPRDVTPRLRKAAIDALLERYTNAESERRARAAYEEAEFPAQVQAFDRLVVDASDHLWARRTPLPGEPLATWDIFDSEGDLVAAAETPEGVAVWQIGDDWVLGSVRDPLGVEQVVAFGLSRHEKELTTGGP